MSKEAMKLALEALDALCPNDYSGYEMGKRDTHLVDTAITAIEEALAQPAPVQPEYCGPLIGCVNHDCDKCKEQSKQEQGEQDTLAYREAASLAKWLFNKHFAHEEHYASGRVVWGLCDTTAGVISQIDNMVCKLVREQEQGEVQYEKK